MSFDKGIFRNHTADYYETFLPFANRGKIAKTESLYWRESSPCLAIHYLCAGPILHITGDIGSAIYQWSAPVTLEGISTNSLDYFASKCQASPYGRGYQEWSVEYAKQSLHELFNTITEETDDINKPGEIKKRFDDANGWRNIDYDWEWCAWCEKNAAKIFGKDWTEICSPKIGYTVSIECEMQLEGLKMAIQYLKEKNNEMQSLQELATRICKVDYVKSIRQKKEKNNDRT